jgi:hypothetical protein
MGLSLLTVSVTIDHYGTQVVLATIDIVEAGKP